MTDLYIIIIPFFGIMICVTLIILKYTLAEPQFKDLHKYQRKIPTKQNQHVKDQVKSEDELTQTGFKKTIKYLLKNYTLAEFYFIRRSRNKVPFLLSISMIALLSLLFDIPYVFSIIGGLVTIIYAFGRMLNNQYEDNKNNQKVNPVNVKEEERMRNKIEIVFMVIAIGLELMLVGLVYKNYKNTALLSFVQNLLVNLALDNLVIKPVLLMLFAFPIQNIQFVDEFINIEIQIVEILQEIRIYKKHALHISAKSPKKHQTSPSKVPKACLQIEPRVKNEQKQKYLSTFELHKNLRKSKLSPISLRKRAYPNQQGNSSLMSIYNSNQKSKKSKQFNQSFDLDKKTQEVQDQQNNKKNTHQSQQSSKFNFDGRKKNKLYSSKMVMINAENSIINGLQVQNQQDQQYKSSIINLKNQKSQNGSRLGKNDQLLLVSLNNGNMDQIRLNSNGENSSNEPEFNQLNRVISSLEDQSIIGPSSIQTSRKIGLLKIHQDKNAQDLEEIDLNSPERRRQQLGKIVQQGDKDKIKKKKPHKKFSLDPNRHVIKHSTGQPYLEFLPNLLNKQRQEKKKRTQQSSQQQFSRKIDFNDSRFSKSVKRTKNTKDPIVRENDENRIPEFVIEDFQS